MRLSKFWKGLVFICSAVATVTSVSHAIAQIIPDTTLGNENNSISINDLKQYQKC
jgi:hypothetical protein